ncbi:arginine deiminase family protein [Promicromonospora sp. NPDC023805]|uniref:dimethylarginine dimethylaminohydrolase family protein n=1 Tax=Promicromonospora sp. NPDC023805 TaxID=3154696 RepID=UPI0033E5C51A
MGLRGSSAYHGPGWQPRQGTLVDDVRAGAHWRSYAVDADWAPLRAVALHSPSAERLDQAPPDVLQHLDRVDAAALEMEIDVLAAVYRGLGIEVHMIPPLRVSSLGRSLAGANAMYARDLFWMTPGGAVLSRMASVVRAGEEAQAFALLASIGVPVVRSVSGTGTFEGADALSLRPDLVAIGYGRRTNPQGLAQAAAIAEEQGRHVITVAVPDGVQHLLGVVQVLDEDLLAVRTELVRPEDVAALRNEGFDLLSVAESEEVRERLGFNFVVVGPRTVVMIAGSPGLEQLLTQHGVEVAASIAVPQLLRGAGGIACATAVLSRDRVGGEFR